MNGALSFGVLCFTSFFTIINPVSVAPVFVAMTDQYDAKARRGAAIKSCAVALGILLVFAASGSFIFQTFGITIDALRIAGGILFFAMSMPMLTGSEETSEKSAESLGTDPAVVPLGMPLICGPGAISTVMVLMGQQTSALHVASLLVGLILALAVTALVLLVAPAIVRLVGRTGIEVVTKVIGLIVCAIGIQFIIDGVRPIALGILAAAR